MAWRLHKFKEPLTIVVGIPVRYAHTPHCYVDFSRLPSGERISHSINQKNLDADKNSSTGSAIVKGVEQMKNLCVMRY